MTTAGLMPSDRPLPASSKYEELKPDEISQVYYYGGFEVDFKHQHLLNILKNRNKADALIKVSWQSNTYDLVFFQWHHLTLRATPVRYLDESKK